MTTPRPRTVRSEPLEVDAGSLHRRVRWALDQVGTEIATLGFTVEGLDAAVREVSSSASQKELRQAAISLRSGVLQVLVSVSGVLAGAGKLAFATDVLDIAEAERPIS